jgi:hypothetical protein
MRTQFENNVLRKIIGPKRQGKRQQETDEDYIMRSCMICAAHLNIIQAIKSRMR